MAITSAEITSTTHAAFIPEIWAEDTRDAIEFAEVLSKLVDTRHEAEMSIGRILHIPHRSNLVTQTKTEGISNTIVFNAVTQTNQDITVSTYEYAAVLLNAVVQAQSKYADRAALSRKMGYALVRGMELSISNLFQNFTRAVGVYGADTDDAVLREAWQIMADLGYYEDANWVFSPGAAQSLFGQERIVSKDFVSTERTAIETAKLPTLFSFPAYVSNLLRSPSSGAHDNALIRKDAIILIRQVKPTPKAQYRIEYNADALLMFDLYGVAEAEVPVEAPPSDYSGPQSSATEVLGGNGAVLIRGK
jgi:hypothetical protein